MKWFRLFGRGEPADGTVPALEALATGISPAMLDSLDATSMAAAGRRVRVADPGSAVVAEVIGTKLLLGWLQNRHQTLVPLTLNLSVMRQEQQAALARILASLLLAGRPRAEAVEVAPELRTWLSGLGAAPSVLSAYDQALDAPLPLNAAFDIAQANDLQVYMFVVALMASDTRFPVSELLRDAVQARFDLPTAVIRSATRRYRR